MTGMLRINPGLVLLSCFCLALYLMIGSVEDWGDFQTDWESESLLFESLWPPDWSILSLDCTLIAKHQEDYQ